MFTEHVLAFKEDQLTNGLRKLRKGREQKIPFKQEKEQYFKIVAYRVAAEHPKVRTELTKVDRNKINSYQYSL